MKKLILFLLAILTMQNANAIDISELGDFSSRSLIIKNTQNDDKNYISNQEIKDILISKKLSPTIQCLNEQISKKNYDNVYLLMQTNMDLNQNFFGEYPLYKASKTNQFELVELLIKNGAKPDRGFYSELYEAIKNKKEKMAKFLIDNNAKINYQNAITLQTNLSMALKNNMYDIAKILIQKGAYADDKSIKLIKKKKLDISQFVRSSN